MAIRFPRRNDNLKVYPTITNVLLTGCNELEIYRQRYNLVMLKPLTGMFVYILFEILDTYDLQLFLEASISGWHEK